VDWASHLPWLHVSTPAEVADLPITNTTNANGYIFIFPFTEVQSPDDSSVYFNIYAWSDDMHFNGFTLTNAPLSRIVEPPEMDIKSESCRLAVPVESQILNPSTSDHTNRNLLHFGEGPVSNRSLMKRFMYAKSNQTVAANSVPPPKALIVESQILPDNFTPFAATATITDLFSYFRYAYLGIKGGMRFRTHVTMALAQNTGHWNKYTLLPPENSFNSSNSYTTNLVAARASGSITEVQAINAGMGAEFPHYSPNLFQICFSDTYELGVTEGFMDGLWYRNFAMIAETPSSAINAGTFFFEAAAAEDFSLMRFQGGVYFSSQ